MFRHIYIERRVADHPTTRALCAKYTRAHIIWIDHYKEVFNRSGQDFAAQARHKKLILAHKEGKFLHEGSPYSDGFEHERFFYASTMMGCLYDCTYCYLQGMYKSAHIVLFVNLEAAFEEVLAHEGVDTLIATSYDTDTLALEALTHHTPQWLSFAQDKAWLHLEIRTKSVSIKPFLSIPPNPNVIFALTLSPQEVIEAHEHNTPSLEQRIKAIADVIDHGWKVRVCIDPILHIEGFVSVYTTLIERLFAILGDREVYQITVGSFRMSADHLRALKRLRRSWIPFYPYDVRDEIATYPHEVSMVQSVLEALAPYHPLTRTRTWQRQS